MDVFLFVLLVLTFAVTPVLIGRFCGVNDRAYWEAMHRETRDIPERPDADARKAS